MSAQNPNNPARQPWDRSQHQSPVGPRHPDPEDLTLFAMQLLAGDDAAVVAQHIEHCADCRREVALVRADLGAYAHTVDMHQPTAAARQRLLRQVGREKKVVPISAAPMNPALATYGRTSALLGEEEARPRRSAGRAVLGWSGWAVAAGLAVASTFLYKDRESLRGTLGTQSGQLARLTADASQAHQLMDALTDPQAVRVTLTTKPIPPAAIGRATYNPDKGTLIFLVSKLDPLPPTKTYELWLIPADGTASLPAGTFHPDDQGNASVIMPDIPKGVAAKGFGVTIEDDGGAQTPTKPIIMAGF